MENIIEKVLGRRVKVRGMVKRIGKRRKEEEEADKKELLEKRRLIKEKWRVEIV